MRAPPAILASPRARARQAGNTVSGTIRRAGRSRLARRFVQPEIHPFSNKPIKVPFDCLMELWWQDRGTFDQAMAALGEGDNFQRIYEDVAA